MSDETAVITDPASLVSQMDAGWKETPPRRWDRSIPVPLMGSAHDQGTVGENPYWDIVRRLPIDSSWRTGGPTEVDGFPKFGGAYLGSRSQLTKTFAWAIPSPGDIAWIKDVLDGQNTEDIVEIGAGTGYWAWQLSQSGVDVLAFDVAPLKNDWCGGIEYHPVRKGGTEMAGEFAHRALMLCWPPYDVGMAEDALRAYDGDTLIYIGESEGGCTAGDGFFSLREKEWEHLGDSPSHVTFSGIHCYVEAYRRKQVTS